MSTYALNLYADSFMLGAENPPYPESPFIFLVDDDSLFSRQLKRAAKQADIQLICYDPEKDIDRLPNDGDFDVALIDYNLGKLSGSQVAALYDQTRVVLISSDNDVQLLAPHWPMSVHGFVRKSKGMKAILKEAMRVAAEPQDF